VIIADMRSSMVAAKFAAAFGCALDFDLISDGVASTPLISGAQRLGQGDL